MLSENRGAALDADRRGRGGCSFTAENGERGGQGGLQDPCTGGRVSQLLDQREVRVAAIPRTRAGEGADGDAVARHRLHRPTIDPAEVATGAPGKEGINATEVGANGRNR